MIKLNLVVFILLSVSPCRGYIRGATSDGLDNGVIRQVQSGRDLVATTEPVPATPTPTPTPVTSKPTTAKPVTSIPVTTKAVSSKPVTEKPAEEAATEPTGAPTESPAPSPSPSMAPTGDPTGTSHPSPAPSSAPTETEMPSPSPTSVPTHEPTTSPSDQPSMVPSASPTDYPSESPSASPTLSPTVSPAPSNAPSHSLAPSSSPSVSPAPTTSSAPSSMPSISPTGLPSASPSDIPTQFPTITASPTVTPETASVSTITAVTLVNIHEKLHEEALGVFTEKTRQFIQSQLPVDAPVNITIQSVTVLDQAVVDSRRLNSVSRSTGSDRKLQDTGLRIRIAVDGEISPGRAPKDFSFFQLASAGFTNNYAAYIKLLSDAHPDFEAMVQSPLANSAESNGNSGGSGPNGAGATVGIVVGALAAVAIGVAAALYAIRRSDHVSPKRLEGNCADSYQISHSDSHSTTMTPYEAGASVSKTPTEQLYSEASVESKSSFFSRTYAVASEGSLKSKQPIVSTVESVPKSLLGTLASNEEFFDEPDDVDMSTMLTHAVLAAHSSKADPPTEPGSDPPGGRNPLLRLPSGCFSSDDESSPKASMTPGSVAVSSTGSFENAMLTPGSLLSPGSSLSGVLGARPMGNSEQTSYEAPPARRTGLYDVYAPAGPLGIVVDTTRDGPVVHSMKPTSTLLGLITQGDLIVGLDDMDTRSMTAATLTRIMAKRSHQPERKITLLAVDN